MASSMLFAASLPESETAGQGARRVRIDLD
jgi:hypothetical protein